MSNIGFMSNVDGKWFFAIYQYIYYTQINENKIAKLPNSIQLSSLFHFSTKMFSSNQNIGESCPHNCFVQYSLMPKWSMTSYDQWMNEWMKKTLRQSLWWAGNKRKMPNYKTSISHRLSNDDNFSANQVWMKSNDERKTTMHSSMDPVICFQG